MIDLAQNIARLQAAMNMPEGAMGGRGFMGTAGPTGPDFAGIHEQEKRRAGSVVTARPSPQGYGSPMGNRILAQKGMSNPALSREAASTSPMMSGVDPSTPAAWHNGPTGWQPRGGTVAGPSPMVGLRQQEDVYKAHESAARSGLDEAKTQEQYQKTAEDWESANAYGAGGIKKYEADQRLAGEMASVHEREAALDATLAAKPHYGGGAATPHPVAESPYSTDAAANMSRAGQDDLMGQRNAVRQLPAGNGGLIPKDVARLFYQQAGGDPVKATQMAVAAGFKAQ